MNSVVQIIDMQNDIGHVTRRALDEAVAAFNAKCGAVHLHGGGVEALVQIHGPWEECGDVVSVPIEGDGRLLGRLSLGLRDDGAEYTERDLEALRAALVPVGRAIQLAHRAA